MNTVVRSGLLGTGFMSRVHAQAVLANGGRIAGVVGSSIDSARESAAHYGAEPVADISELIDMGVDVIHVCTPNSLHFEQASAAIAAGIAVICEKPLATSPEQAATLVTLAAASGVTTAVPFAYRYYPLVRTARDRIAADPDNRIWLAHGSYLQDWLASPAATNWRIDPRKGGSSRAFGDIGVHWCDLMEFVTGQRITRLTARLGNAFERTGGSAQNATEDGGVVSFETDAGALGSVVISQASAGRANRLWFSFDGPSASYSFDQELPETLWVGAADGAKVIGRNPALQSGRPGALPAGHPQGYQHCFIDLVDDVFQSLEGSTVAGMPTFRDGLRAALITSAVVESATTQQWVDVPTVDGYLASIT